MVDHTSSSDSSSSSLKDLQAFLGKAELLISHTHSTACAEALPSILDLFEKAPTAHEAVFSVLRGLCVGLLSDNKARNSEICVLLITTRLGSLQGAWRPRILKFLISTLWELEHQLCDKPSPLSFEQELVRRKRLPVWSSLVNLLGDIVLPPLRSHSKNQETQAETHEGKHEELSMDVSEWIPLLKLDSVFLNEPFGSMAFVASCLGARDPGMLVDWLLAIAISVIGTAVSERPLSPGLVALYLVALSSRPAARKVAKAFLKPLLSGSLHAGTASALLSLCSSLLPGLFSATLLPGLKWLSFKKIISLCRGQEDNWNGVDTGRLLARILVPHASPSAGRILLHYCLSFTGEIRENMSFFVPGSPLTTVATAFRDEFIAMMCSSVLHHLSDRSTHPLKCITADAISEYEPWLKSLNTEGTSDVLLGTLAIMCLSSENDVVARVLGIVLEANLVDCERDEEFRTNGLETWHRLARLLSLHMPEVKRMAIESVVCCVKKDSIEEGSLKLRCRLMNSLLSVIELELNDSSQDEKDGDAPGSVIAATLLAGEDGLQALLPIEDFFGLEALPFLNESLLDPFSLPHCLVLSLRLLKNSLKLASSCIGLFQGFSFGEMLVFLYVRLLKWRCNVQKPEENERKTELFFLALLSLVRKTTVQLIQTREETLPVILSLALDCCFAPNTADGVFRNVVCKNASSPDMPPNVPAANSVVSPFTLCSHHFTNKSFVSVIPVESTLSDAPIPCNHSVPTLGFSLGDSPEAGLHSRNRSLFLLYFSTSCDTASAKQLWVEQFMRRLSPAVQPPTWEHRVEILPRTSCFGYDVFVREFCIQNPIVAEMLECIAEDPTKLCACFEPLVSLLASCISFWGGERFSVAALSPHLPFTLRLLGVFKKALWLPWPLSEAGDALSFLPSLEVLSVLTSMLYFLRDYPPQPSSFIATNSQCWKRCDWPSLAAIRPYTLVLRRAILSVVAGSWVLPAEGTSLSPPEPDPVWKQKAQRDLPNIFTRFFGDNVRTV